MNTFKQLASACLGLLFLFSPLANASLPDGFYIDHGYTFFTLESTSTPIDGNATDTGWKLNGAIRIFGDAPERSSIKLVVKLDGDVLAERRTTTEVFKKGSPKLSLTIGNTAAGTNFPHLISGTKHQGVLDAVTTGTGEYEVDVFYIDGDSDKEYLAHTYTINVGKIDSLDRVAGKLKVRPPSYVVSRHQEILTSILSPWYGYRISSGTFVLLWNASPLTTDGRPAKNDEYLRCSVDGEPLKLGNPKYPQYDSSNKYDESVTKVAQDRGIRERHIDRNSLDYRSGTAYREHFILNNYLTLLPFEDDTDDYPPEGWDQETRHTLMSRHPGRWECQLLDNGTVLRTFAWDVDKRGKLVPHPEQKEGLTLNPGAILVETTIPAGGAQFDGRIVPDAVKAGGFYGRKWESRRMKKLSKKLPEVGTPYPVASAAEFVPEPDKGPSPQELAKEKRQADAASAREQRKADQQDRDTRLAAEREQFSKDDAARVAENERIRSEAMDKESARTDAMVAEQLAGAKASSAEAIRQAEKSAAASSPMHILFRVALAVALVLSGLLLAGNKIPPVAAFVEKLEPLAVTIGLATVGISLFDLVLDILILRPIVGDGLVQAIGLISGGLLARGTLEKLIKNEKVSALLDTLNDNKTALGFAAIAFGVIHLILGSAVLI